MCRRGSFISKAVFHRTPSVNLKHWHAGQAQRAGAAERLQLNAEGGDALAEEEAQRHAARSQEIAHAKKRRAGRTIIAERAMAHRVRPKNAASSATGVCSRQRRAAKEQRQNDYAGTRICGE